MIDVTASIDKPSVALSQSLQDDAKGTPHDRLLASYETVSSDSFVLPSGNIYCAVVFWL
jgi:hypothetical protein